MLNTAFVSHEHVGQVDLQTRSLLCSCSATAIPFRLCLLRRQLRKGRCIITCPTRSSCSAVPFFSFQTPPPPQFPLETDMPIFSFSPPAVLFMHSSCAKARWTDGVRILCVLLLQPPSRLTPGSDRVSSCCTNTPFLSTHKNHLTPRHMLDTKDPNSDGTHRRQQAVDARIQEIREASLAVSDEFLFCVHFYFLRASVRRGRFHRLPYSSRHLRFKEATHW